jgi:hypothetical protein
MSGERALVPMWQRAYNQLIDSLAVSTWVDAMLESRGVTGEERCAEVVESVRIVNHAIVNS